MIQAPIEIQLRQILFQNLRVPPALVTLTQAHAFLVSLNHGRHICV